VTIENDLFVSSVAADGDGTAIVYGRGELDAYSARPFAETLERVTDNGDLDRVVVDFSDVSFLDSSGLRVLLGTARRLAERGGKFVLVAKDVRVVNVVRLTGTMDMLDLRPTLAEALGRAEGL
jgi:anti-anti-sigma factor